MNYPFNENCNAVNRHIGIPKSHTIPKKKKKKLPFLVHTIEVIGNLNGLCKIFLFVCVCVLNKKEMHTGLEHGDMTVCKR